MGGAERPGSSEVPRSAGLPRGSFSFPGSTPEPRAGDLGLGPGELQRTDALEWLRQRAGGPEGRGGVGRWGQPGTRESPGPQKGGATWEHLLLEVSETGSPPGTEAAA